MIRGKFLGCFVAIFFLSYSIISLYCNPASGSAFPMGSSIVLCAAKDPVTSLVSYAMFNVTVKDASPPTFMVPQNILKQADNLQGTTITYNANATDAVEGSTVTTCNPPSGSTFPLGLNQVKCTAKDKSGNTAEASFSVIIGQTPSDQSTETGISTLSENVTNQLVSPELTVSENDTDDTPELTVSENDTDDTPALTVSENDTDDTPELTVSENDTDDTPELTVSENDTDDTPELTVSENDTDGSSTPLREVIENDTDDPQVQQLESNLNENNDLIKVAIDSLQNHRATEGSLIKIKGTSVHDSGNEKLSFTWKQTGGEPVGPEDARLTSQTIASGIAPQIGGNITNLTFEVTVPQVNTNDDDKLINTNDDDKLTFEIIAKDDNG